MRPSGKAAPRPKLAIVKVAVPAPPLCAARTDAAPSVGPPQGLQTAPRSRPTRSWPPRPRKDKRASGRRPSRRGRRRRERHARLQRRRREDEAGEDLHDRPAGADRVAVDAEGEADGGDEQADSDEGRGHVRGQGDRTEAVLARCRTENDRNERQHAGRENRHAASPRRSRSRRASRCEPAWCSDAGRRKKELILFTRVGSAARADTHPKRTPHTSRERSRHGAATRNASSHES